MRQTNPISGAERAGPEGRWYKRSQFAAVQTNPIRGHGAWGEAEEAEGRLRQTNPISASGPAGATVQTKPIPSAGQHSQVLGRKRVMVNTTYIPNKANSWLRWLGRGRRDACAKQTQFGAADRPGPEGPWYKQSQFAAVQTNPIRGPAAGKTIAGRRPCQCHGAKAIAPNKPNSRHRAGPGVESIVRNKPNSQGVEPKRWTWSPPLCAGRTRMTRRMIAPLTRSLQIP
jgi:hypothetical protein